MAIPFSGGQWPAPTLITPECDAPGCDVAGDQYTMVRCRGCGAWFCPEHIAGEEGVTLVHPIGRALSGLAYYQGSCVPCQQARQRTHH
jgi:hypothetical protein